MNIFADEFVPNEEASTGHKNWVKANKGEAAKWAAFRNAIIAWEPGDPPVTAPAMATKHGKALVAAGKEHMSVTDIGSVPPTATNTLPWAPPVNDSPNGVVNFTMDNNTRQSSTLLSGAGRDLVITATEALTGPVVQINNWRNVTWIGGKITDTGLGDRYALPISATGTVHIEGLDIRCDGDALMSRGGSANCVWQVQNCRLEVHFNGGTAEHADCFQLQGNSQINSLRFARCTLLTDYQGFMLRYPSSSAFLNGGDFRQLNFRRRSGLGDPAQAWLFIPDEEAPGSTFGHTVGEPSYIISMTDVWAESTHSSGNWIFYPSWLFEHFSMSVGNFGNLEGIFRLTDGTGQYVRPSTTSDVVPAGGSASGQQCESAGWTGIIRMGIPPGGDYCPVGVPGMSYISPGYG